MPRGGGFGGFGFAFFGGRWELNERCPSNFWQWSHKYGYSWVVEKPEGSASIERIVPAGEFKTNCLRLMDEVRDTGADIVVTKHRRPVVRVSPFRQERPRLVGSCSGQLRILGDIDTEPAIPPDDWDVIARPERILDPEERG